MLKVFCKVRFDKTYELLYRTENQSIQDNQCDAWYNKKGNAEKKVEVLSHNMSEQAVVANNFFVPSKKWKVSGD